MSTRRILFLSHSHPFGPFRVGSHHYAAALARSGADVVHLSTPISLMHRVTGRVDRAAAAVVPRGPHTDTDGVTFLVPRTVLSRPLGPFRVARELARHGIRPAFDAVLIDQPLLWDNSVRMLSDRLIYRPTDNYPSGIKAKLQRQIIEASDGVIATSTEVLRELGPLSTPTLVLENGVDAARYASARTDTRPPVCVYVGALDDPPHRAQVDPRARAHPEVRFIIAGPHPAPPSAMASNVQLRGPVPYDMLPDLLHSARVGLLPLSDDPLNAGRSPMKLYEYLAAGLTVVARETPVIRPDHSAGLFTYPEQDAAARALRDALAFTSPNSAGIQRAAVESWDAKTATLSQFVRDLPAH